MAEVTRIPQPAREQAHRLLDLAFDRWPGIEERANLVLEALDTYGAPFLEAALAARGFVRLAQAANAGRSSEIGR
jgi:hypothetical protein